MKIKIAFLILVVFITSCYSNQKKEEEMHPLAKLKTPIFWAEGHPGKLNREDWQIEVTGLCKKPQIFTWSDLQKMPKSEADARLTSVTRWSVRGIWGGIRISDILDSVQVSDKVKYVRFWSYESKYDTSIPIEIARQEKSLLAWEYNNVLLTEDYGGPIRVFCPYLWGYKSAKSVIKIELLDKYIPGYWEKRGYTDSGEIEAGIMRDVNDEFRFKDIPKGEVKDF